MNEAENVTIGATSLHYPKLISFFQLLFLTLHRREDMRFVGKGFNKRIIFLECEYLTYVSR